jgi:tetratricopeptide (TPR) repeat protein
MKVNVKLWMILFFGMNVTGAASQNLEQTYQLAQEAYQRDDHQQAISYYQRVLFFDHEQAYTQLIFEKLAESHFQLKSYEESAFFFDIAYNLENGNTSKQNTLLIRRALCYIYLQEYQNALKDLYLLEAPKEATAMQAALLEGMCQFRLNNFDAAQEALNHALKDEGDTVILVNNYRRLDKINRKSPKKAKVFSMIIPGSGLIYVGDWKNGSSSLLLVGGLTTLMVVSTINTGFVNAFLNIFPWYQRYYMGGYKLTEKVAREKLDTRRLKLLQQMIDEIGKANAAASYQE